MKAGRHNAVLFAALTVLVVLFCSMNFGTLQGADFIAERKTSSGFSDITEFLYAEPEGDEAPIGLYDGFNLISRGLFFKYQVGGAGDYMTCYESVTEPAAYSEVYKGTAGYRLKSWRLADEYRGEREEGFSYIIADFELENTGEHGGLFAPYLYMALMKNDGSFEEGYDYDFKTVDIIVEDGAMTYACYSEVTGDKKSGNNGYVRCSDWEKAGFSIYLAEEEKTTFSCVFRLSDEDVDSERLVIGKDNAAAAQNFFGEVAYSNRGFRIYLNK